MCKIEFNLDEPAFVTVNVVDVMGALVKTVLADHKPAGHYDLDFNPDALFPGRYYYKVFAEPDKHEKKQENTNGHKVSTLLKTGSVNIRENA